MKNSQRHTSILCSTQNERLSLSLEHNAATPPYIAHKESALNGLLLQQEIISLAMKYLFPWRQDISLIRISLIKEIILLFLLWRFSLLLKRDARNLPDIFIFWLDKVGPKRLLVKHANSAPNMPPQHLVRSSCVWFAAWLYAAPASGSQPDSPWFTGCGCFGNTSMFTVILELC